MSSTGPHINIVIGIVGVIATILLFSGIFMGCEPIIKHDYPEWRTAYDADWSAVLACWNAPADTEKPIVVVHEECVEIHGSGAWYLKGYEGWVYGYQHYPFVEVCGDLAALRHEFSHHVTVAAFNRRGFNGDGVCWL
jgi:hypothetical protein